MRTIHVFYIFSLYTSISISNITLSFIESWAHPIVVVIVKVVVVQVAVLTIHVPHVVSVVSRTKPINKLKQEAYKPGTYLVLPYIKIHQIMY